MLRDFDVSGLSCDCGSLISNNIQVSLRCYFRRVAELEEQTASQLILRTENMEHELCPI